MENIIKFFNEAYNWLGCLKPSASGNLNDHGTLVIPAFYANGWVSLEDHTILVSLSNLRYDKAKHDDIRINPYVIGEEKWQVIGR